MICKNAVCTPIKKAEFMRGPCIFIISISVLALLISLIGVASASPTLTLLKSAATDDISLPMRELC